MDEKMTKKCPYCGEAIRREAIKCRYCLSMLAERTEDQATEKGAEIREEPREPAYAGYQKAGLGKRFLAFLVDSVVASLGFFLLVPMLIPRFIFAFNQGYRYGMHYPAFHFNNINIAFLASAGLLLLLAGLWAVLYHLLKDGFGRGQSLGKRFAGLMVVQLDNDQPCGLGTSLVRNLVQLLLSAIPGIGFFVEPVVLALHEKGQRLGDLAGRTQVIEATEYRR